MEHGFAKKIKPLLVYSAIVVGILILWTILADVGGFYTGKFNRWFGSFVFFAGLVYSVYGYRKEYCNNQISYSQAVGFGVLLSLVVGLVISVINYYYIHEVSPEIYEELRMLGEEKMMERGMTDYQIELAQKQGEKFQTPFFSALFGTVIYTVLGLIVSLIAASFLKKEPAHPFEGVE